MDNAVRNLFLSLSQNKLLNEAAKRWGLKLGAQHVVAGTNLDDTIKSIKKLNELGISCTVDNLGEFVNNKFEATSAKDQILKVVEAIHEQNLDAHLSVKLSQLGLDIDFDFCLQNFKEIVQKAKEYNIFINVDMEDHPRLQPSFDIIDKLSDTYDNIGTVIQAYFFRAKDDLQKYKNYRLRLVKGAYKESENVAFQDKKDIDRNYIELIEWHLLNGKFTSIATHDHHVINHVKKFVEKHQIPRDKFEFQLLYGFRENIQKQLVDEGYQVCVYVPFGEDWYGYFMRRLAERPQNLNLLAKQVFNKKTNTLIGIGVAGFLLGRMSKRRK